MIPRTIRADGIDWPLDTFIDAYGFDRLDRFGTTPIDAGHADAVRVDVVTSEGALISDRTADGVIWGDIIAYRPVPGTPAALACRICADPVLRTGDDDICAGCDTSDFA